MSLILYIDTAVQTASVCLADGEDVLSLKVNPYQKDHAAWLHPAIAQVMEEEKVSLQQLKAICISEGPGSYTGLRVGMSAAKGLCYALNIPLIAVSTLQMMAKAVRTSTTDLLCPMIDARRVEVFTAVYDKSLNQITKPTNLVLDENSFKPLLDAYSILFFGNGSEKFKSITSHQNALFETVEATAKHMVPLGFSRFHAGKFADLAYSEPFYGKEFHSPNVN